MQVDHAARMQANRPEFPSEMENDMWMYYARHVCGPERVRGGDVTIVQRHNNDSIPTWLLPEEFGGTRRVDWGFISPY